MYYHSQLVVEPREQHLSWHQLVLRHDDPFWKVAYPPNGWGCQCKVIALTEKSLKRKNLKVGQSPALSRSQKTLKNGRVAEVVDGIDEGWDYNVGEAAWGRKVAEQTFKDFKASGIARWIND